MSIGRLLTYVFAFSTVLCTSFASANADKNRLGIKGDFSASLSARSGRASVLGVHAVIQDVSAREGVVRRPVEFAIRDDIWQFLRPMRNMNEPIAVLGSLRPPALAMSCDWLTRARVR